MLGAYLHFCAYRNHLLTKRLSEPKVVRNSVAEKNETLILSPVHTFDKTYGFRYT
jgi:hypothetical protein